VLLTCYYKKTTLKSSYASQHAARADGYDIYCYIKNKKQLIMRSSSLYQHTAWPDGHEVAINYKEQLGQCAA